MELTVVIPEVRRTGIAYARQQYNASLPATVQDGTEMVQVGEEMVEQPRIVPNPAIIASDEAYVQFVIDRATVSYMASVPVPEPEPEDPGTIDGVPQVVTRKQATKALARAHTAPINHSAPIFESTIEGIISQMPALTVEQQIAKVDTEAEFRYAQTWRRQNPVLIGLAGILGLSSAQLDELFILGASFTE